MEVSGSLNDPTALRLGKSFGTHFIGGWMGPKWAPEPFWTIGTKENLLAVTGIRARVRSLVG